MGDVDHAPPLVPMSGGDAMDEDYGYEDYCDDLNEWETEQVFQDHEGYEPDEFGDFGIDGMGPDGE
jgi:hypothetical protein